LYTYPEVAIHLRPVTLKKFNVRATPAWWIQNLQALTRYPRTFPYLATAAPRRKEK
jgi:hypothetical protein